MFKKYKSSKGITLVALVVTIVVLLILAGISLNMVLGENGIVKKTQDAVEQTNPKSLKEQVDLAIAGATMHNDYQYNKDNAKTEIEKIQGVGTEGVTDNNDGTLTVKKDEITINVDKDGNTTIAGQTGEKPGGSGGGETEIPKDTEPAKSYVANYADIDDDGTVDGIIYADLITGATGDGQWIDSDGNYTISKIDSASAKNYYISQETYEGPFGTGKVISPMAGTTGEDRFYVMALNDIDGKVNGTYYNWYYSAYDKMSDYATYTSQDFGKGKENTDKMIKRWNDQGETKEYEPYYGTQNAGGTNKDLWGEITTEVSKGWYVPSRAEWAAFGEELKIDETNYINLGLSDWYWSSSQDYTYGAWAAHFYYGCMNGLTVRSDYYVRLGSTF